MSLLLKCQSNTINIAQDPVGAQVAPGTSGVGSICREILHLVQQFVCGPDFFGTRKARGCRSTQLRLGVYPHLTTHPGMNSLNTSQVHLTDTLSTFFTSIESYAAMPRFWDENPAEHGQMPPVASEL